MYKHRQIGWLLIAIFLPVVLGLAIWLVFYPLPQAGILGIFLLIVLWLFSTLTVEADNQKISFYFSIGLFGKKIKYSDIQSIQKVRNPWYLGWGIHWFGKGWLYNVSGFDAIELILRSGNAIRIGTDEPDKLYNWLSTRVAHK
jgi:hypothetical protein